MAQRGPAWTSRGSQRPSGSCWRRSARGPIGRGRAPAGPGGEEPRIAAAIRELLAAIGEDPDREGLRDTPARVARSYAEIFGGLHIDPADVLSTTFDENHDEFV